MVDVDVYCIARGYVLGYLLCLVRRYFKVVGRTPRVCGENKISDLIIELDSLELLHHVPPTDKTGRLPAQPQL